MYACITYRCIKMYMYKVYMCIDDYLFTDLDILIIRFNF